MTEAQFLAAIAEALGPLAKSPENPMGAVGIYAEGETHPYVVLCAYEFKTAEEAIAKARQLQAIG